ncbi:uncharacterized lipoprotein YehR (DUF1307 family) [Paenibacillus harenae]|nr:uncharacterized lipoprotein YehR (DUF1307 family) [Paenibacillus harenae]
MSGERTRFQWLTPLVVMLVLLLAACSSANSDSGGMSEEGSSNKNVAQSADESAMEVTTQASAEDGEAQGNAEQPGTGFASGAAAQTDAFSQKIIYSAALSMEVEELEAARTALKNAIHQSGSYILQFQDTKQNGEIGSTYTIKVPADGFMPFIDRIGEIEHRHFETNVTGKDVSEQYVDTESRLKAKQLVESRLLVMMEQAAKADDLLKFSNQLSAVQEEIEVLKGRLRYLDHNVAYSTVELRLYQTDQSLYTASGEKKGLGAKMSDALTGSAKTVVAGLQLLLVIVAGALPVLVVLAIIAIPVVWMMKRKRRSASGGSGNPPADDDNVPPAG